MKKLTVILVVDQIYEKTNRFVTKLREHLVKDSKTFIAIVEGWDSSYSDVPLGISGVFKGDIKNLKSELIRFFPKEIDSGTLRFIALNEFALLPKLAIEKEVLGNFDLGILYACDKIACREIMSLYKCEKERYLSHFNFCTEFVEVNAKSSLHLKKIDSPSGRYVVKPAFGASAEGVKIFNSWLSAVEYAKEPIPENKLFPEDVLETLNVSPERRMAKVIEPFIDGTEFSIDGYLIGGEIYAIVQHKLTIIQSSYIGDGPTVTPPIRSFNENFPNFKSFTTEEKVVCEFARHILRELRYPDSVFHIEGIESNGELNLIEVNARSPGGMLWLSAMNRSGYDLEKIHCYLQLGLEPKKLKLESKESGIHCLHYPLYAANPGKIESWGDFTNTKLKAIFSDVNIRIDTAVPEHFEFKENHFEEEPYLAFFTAITHSEAKLKEVVKVLSGLEHPRLF
jgi:hypothetical protein